MHVMEDESSKPSEIVDNLPKANGSPTSCQNAVPTLDSEKKGTCDKEDAATGTDKDEGKEISSYESLGATKTVTEEEEEQEEEEEDICKDRDGTANPL
jgi:hypothetical protein